MLSGVKIGAIFVPDTAEEDRNQRPFVKNHFAVRLVLTSGLS